MLPKVAFCRNKPMAVPFMQTLHHWNFPETRPWSKTKKVLVSRWISAMRSSVIHTAWSSATQSHQFLYEARELPKSKSEICWPNFAKKIQKVTQHDRRLHVIATVDSSLWQKCWKHVVSHVSICDIKLPTCLCCSMTKEARSLGGLPHLALFAYCASVQKFWSNTPRVSPDSCPHFLLWHKVALRWFSWLLCENQLEGLASGFVQE